MSSAPSCPFKVKAIAPYQARNDTEFSLTVGEVYTVYQTDGKGVWWQTKGANNKPGWFPASYVQVQENTPPPPPPQTVTPPPPTPTPTPTITTTPKPEPPKVTETKKPEPPPQTSSGGGRDEYEKNADIGFSVKTTSIKKKDDEGGSQDECPQPIRPAKIDKGESSSAYVVLQISEARNLRPIDGSDSKTNPQAFVYRKNVMRPNDLDKLFLTDQKKKTIAPVWNERFQINVYDAEEEVILIKFGNGKKLKGKDYLGEVQVPLRGSERSKFEHPNFVFKWYNITGKMDKCPDPTGEIKLYIQYVNTKSIGKPSDVKQVSHIGWSADGGFDIKNIPQEWKKVFKDAGIKPKDLENKEFRDQVFNVMQHAQEEADNSGTAISVNSNAPPPPPMPTLNKNAPPPPPMPSRNPPPNSGSSETSGGSGGPPPPPPPSSSGGRGSLLDEITKGKELKKVVVNDNRQSVGPGGGTLLSTLQNALLLHRKDIEGNDENGDDWSDGEAWDDN